MAVNETPTERKARSLIAEYGSSAVQVAATRLNDSIDRGDWSARDRWARIVHAIHEHFRSTRALSAAQRPGPTKPAGSGL